MNDNKSLQSPPTEIEIAELLSVVCELDAKFGSVVRRLTFERDKYKAFCNETQQLLDDGWKVEFLRGDSNRMYCMRSTRISTIGSFAQIQQQEKCESDGLEPSQAMHRLTEKVYGME